MQQDESFWKEKLTPEQYHVLREKGTELPFTGKYVDFHEEGIFTCAACGNPLFSADTKFDSKTGWPSFYDIVTSGSVILKDDMSHGTRRVEVKCANCEGHLGHVFDDGPREKTGKRYCINSAALNFCPKE